MRNADPISDLEALVRIRELTSTGPPCDLSTPAQIRSAVSAFPVNVRPNRSAGTCIHQQACNPAVCFSRDQHSSSSALQPGLEEAMPGTAVHGSKARHNSWFRRLETAPGGRWSTGRCIPSPLREPAGPRSTSLSALQTQTPIRPRAP